MTQGTHLGALKAFARGRIASSCASHTVRKCLDKPHRSKMKHLCDATVQQLQVQGFNEKQRVLVLRTGSAYLLGDTLIESSDKKRVIKKTTRLLVVGDATDRQYVDTQQVCVVKILSTVLNAADDLADARREIALQRSLDCEFLCELSEVASDNTSIYIIMPFFNGGDLYTRVEKVGGSLPEESCRRHMCDILQGLKYMHRNKIAHLDMSLENVVLKSCKWKETSHIIDFGLARVVEDELNTVRVQHVEGKPVYMSAEIYRNTGKFDGFKADVWACGIMLFIMLTGFPPYTRPLDECYKKLVEHGPAKLIKSWGITVDDEEALSLLGDMLAEGPSDRPSVAKALEHPFLNPSR